MTRVLLADSQPFMRIGLSVTLGSYGVVVVGACRDERDMVPMLVRSTPDVLLIDPRLVRRAVRCLRTVRRVRPGIAIVVFADRPTGAFVRRMRLAGADAVLGRDAEASAIARTLRRAASAQRSPTACAPVPVRRAIRGTRRIPPPARAR
jgi:DNA-binding NarL/FixJ family response regulator